MNRLFVSAIGLLLIFAALVPTTADEAKPATDGQNERPKLKVGDAAPDFEIESEQGTTTRLSDRFAKDGKAGKPVILIFSRAHW